MKMLPACRMPGSRLASGMLRCSGAKRLLISTASSIDFTRMIALFLSIALRATAAGWQRRELLLDFFRDGVGEALRGGEQDGGCLGVVLGLREHVGGDPRRLAFVGDHQDLRGSGDEVDADFAREQLLRRGDIDVARTDDAIGARNRLRAIREGRDRVRAAQQEHVVDSEQRCRSQDLGNRRGDVTQIFGTPATCAGITVIISVEGRG